MINEFIFYCLYKNFYLELNISHLNFVNVLLERCWCHAGRVSPHKKDLFSLCVFVNECASQTVWYCISHEKTRRLEWFLVIRNYLNILTFPKLLRHQKNFNDSGHERKNMFLLIGILSVNINRRCSQFLTQMLIITEVKDKTLITSLTINMSTQFPSLRSWPW